MTEADLRATPDPLMRVLDTDRSGPAVVAIGGGTGLAQALEAVGRYAGRITAIVTVADDGGSSGRLAPALEIPPPGDIRRCLIALTPDDSVWKRLFEYRFDAADVDGHSLGNLIIASLADLEGDFEQALRASEQLLGSIGSVVPVSKDRLGLEAVIEGRRVTGQAEISATRGTVDRLSVLPPGAAASDSALDAIAGADQIVLGPGSLYTSVIACMIVPGITAAINAAPGRLCYVSNLVTQDGETIGMDGADHVDALLRQTGVRSPAAIVANSTEIDVAAPVEPLRFDPEVLATFGVDVVHADLVDPTATWPRHDPARLGGVLGRLASQTNDPEGAP